MSSGLGPFGPGFLFLFEKSIEYFRSTRALWIRKRVEWAIIIESLGNRVDLINGKARKFWAERWREWIGHHSYAKILLLGESSQCFWRKFAMSSFLQDIIFREFLEIYYDELPIEDKKSLFTAKIKLNKLTRSTI